MRKFEFFLRLIFLLFILCTCFSDRGMIYIDPNFSPRSRDYLSQPLQEAVIIWDGKTEILVIRTEINAKEEGLALEILPLPSEPGDIFQVSEVIFDRLSNLFIVYRPLYSVEKATAEGAKTPGVEIIERKEIGAHNVTIIKVNDINEFLGWLEDHYGKFEISEMLESTLIDYILEGYDYLALDVVNLSKMSRLKPLAYVFESEEVYYPLRITRASFKGYNEIRIYLITPWPLKSNWREFLIYGKKKVDLEEILSEELLLIKKGWVHKLEKYTNTENLRDDLLIKYKEFERFYFFSEILGDLKYFKDIEEILGKIKYEGYKEFMEAFITIFVSIMGFLGVLMLIYRKIRRRITKAIFLVIASWITFKMSFWVTLPVFFFFSIYFLRNLRLGKVKDFSRGY